MPMTEDDLRQLLRTRAQDVPSAAGLADRAEAAGRRQRATVRAGAAAVLVAVLAVTATVALPRVVADVPPVSPTPSASEGQLVVEQELNGLRVRTSGPAAISGQETFTLTLDVTNPGTDVWAGEVGVGLVRRGAPASAGVPLLLPAGPAPEPAPDILTGFSTDLGDGRVFEGATTNLFVDVAPGGASSWSVQLRRNPDAPVVGSPTGWAAYVMPAAAAGKVAVGDVGQVLDIEQGTIELACSEISDLTWQMTSDQRWRLGSAQQVVVEQDGAPPQLGNLSSWEPVEIRLDQDPAGASVSVILSALDAAGTGASSSRGLPEPTLVPEAFARAARYVLYSAANMVDVRFSGTCQPAGEPVAGLATLYGADGTNGIVDCDTGPDATEAARLAATYCPKQ